MFDLLARSFGTLAISAAEALESLVRVQPIMPSYSSPRPVGYRCKRGGTFDNRVNRHTGKPHEHKREIARRTRRVA